MFTKHFNIIMAQRGDLNWLKPKHYALKCLPLAGIIAFYWVIFSQMCFTGFKCLFLSLKYRKIEHFHKLICIHFWKSKIMSSTYCFWSKSDRKWDKMITCAWHPPHNGVKNIQIFCTDQNILYFKHTSHSFRKKYSYKLHYSYHFVL